MSNKSGYQKALKVISIIELICGVLALLGALLSFGLITAGPEATSQTFTADGVTLTAGQGIAVFGIVMILSGFLALLVGVLGIRGANDPHKVGAYLVIAVITLVVDVVELVLTCISMAQGTADTSSLISAIVSVVLTGLCVYIACKVKAQAR